LGKKGYPDYTYIEVAFEVPNLFLARYSCGLIFFCFLWVAWLVMVLMTISAWPTVFQNK
jgi:hypothetical protein